MEKWRKYKSKETRFRFRRRLQARGIEVVEGESKFGGVLVRRKARREKGPYKNKKEIRKVNAQRITLEVIFRPW